MISRTIFSALIFILLICPNLSSQTLEPGQELSGLTQVEKTERLQANFIAVSSAFIIHAKQNETDIKQAGEWLGNLFAISWGNEQTPQSFVEGMNRNWQMFDISTEIIEATETKIVAKRGLIMPRDEFNSNFGRYGVTLSEFQVFYASAMKAITSRFNLSYSEKVKGDEIEFTVQKK